MLLFTVFHLIDSVLLCHWISWSAYWYGAVLQSPRLTHLATSSLLTQITVKMLWYTWSSIHDVLTQGSHQGWASTTQYDESAEVRGYQGCYWFPPGIVYPRKLALGEKLPSIVTKYYCDFEPLTVTWGFAKSRETGEYSQYKQTMQTYKMCYVLCMRWPCCVSIVIINSAHMTGNGSEILYYSKSHNN